MVAQLLLTWSLKKVTIWLTASAYLGDFRQALGSTWPVAATTPHPTATMTAPHFFQMSPVTCAIDLQSAAPARGATAFAVSINNNAIINIRFMFVSPIHLLLSAAFLSATEVNIRVLCAWRRVTSRNRKVTRYGRPCW